MCMSYRSFRKKLYIYMKSLGRRPPFRLQQSELITRGLISRMSPSKTLLYKIHHPKLLHAPHSATDIISKATRTTDSNAHGALLFLDLVLQEEFNIRATGFHIDGSRDALDLAGVFGARDEEFDAEDVATFGHCEDDVHPGGDPFQLFRVAEDPDEGYSAGGDCHVDVALEEMLDVGDLVGDS